MKLSKIYLRQSKVLWDLGFGDVLGFKTLDVYRKGTDAMQGIMEIPGWPKFHRRSLDRNVLVDGRVIEQVGLKEFCRMCGITYDGRDNSFVPYDPSVARSDLRWMHAQDGRHNHGYTPKGCRTARFICEAGLDHVEGISLYLQYPNVLKERHVMHLPGSIHAADCCAYLGLRHGTPRLSWIWEGHAHLCYGSASRGK